MWKTASVTCMRLRRSHIFIIILSVALRHTCRCVDERMTLHFQHAPSSPSHTVRLLHHTHHTHLTLSSSPSPSHTQLTLEVREVYWPNSLLPSLSVRFLFALQSPLFQIPEIKKMISKKYHAHIGSDLDSM